MSGTYGKVRRSKSRSPVDDYAKRSLLAKVNKSELKLLRVAVRRSDVIGGGPHLPLERSIDDPARICTYVHYQKDENKGLQLPVFGKGIKVNQDFTENRCVFTHEKNNSKPSRKSRSRSRYRSRSPRNRTRSPSRSGKTKSQERGRNERSRRSISSRRSRSRDRSKSKRRRRSSSRRGSSRISPSKYRSGSRERRYSSERRKYKDDSHQYTSQRARRSPSPFLSQNPHEHEKSCPMYQESTHQRKSLTPLRPGEYRPGHPDLALRNKRQKSRSRSRSYDKPRSKRSRSRDNTNLPSTSRDKSSPGGQTGSVKTSKRYQNRDRSDNRDRRSKSRSPVRSDRYRRRSRSPYNNHSPSKRAYRGDRNRSPRKRSRSPQYGENMHGEYGYYEGWGPGPRLPAGRGGFPMQPFYAPAFHPRGMMPGPLIPPGHMFIPRIPIMPPYGPYRPHLPIYNSGAVRQRGPRPNSKPSTVTSEKDGDCADSRVVITELSSRDDGKNEENVQSENAGNLVDKKGGQEKGDDEGKNLS